MPQYSKLLHTITKADAQNTPALFRQQSVPTLVVRRDHTPPVLLDLTLVYNHRGIDNYTVTFRTPCIMYIAFTRNYSHISFRRILHMLHITTLVYHTAC